MGVYRLELSKSGRALCRNTECKNNGVKIATGELRWCSLFAIKENQSWQYKHWGCVTPKQIANLKETIEDNLDLLDGYEELDTESQDKVRKALTDGHVDDSDWKGDPEQNRPGKTGFRSPKKRLKPTTEDSENEGAAPSPSKPSKKKRGRAKLEENDEDANANGPLAKKAKKQSAKVKKAKGDDAIHNSEPDAQSTKKGRAEKAKSQAGKEQLDTKEESSDHDVVPELPQMKRGRMLETTKLEEIKSEGSDTAVGAELTEEAPQPRRSHKRAAAPSKFEREDEENDPESAEEANKTKKASEKAIATAATKQKKAAKRSVTSKIPSGNTEDVDVDIDSTGSAIVETAPKIKRGIKKAVTTGSTSTTGPAKRKAKRASVAKEAGETR